ncbi:hypothetical protein LCGC14_2866890, partial [marine sediment metagenome]
MTNRRTHSVIDRLPEDVRDVLMRMAVDNVWPHDWAGETDGKPTYDDMVLYCSTQGCVVSRSAIGRWAKRMQVYERMKTAGAIARDVMKGLSDENATQTQKAAAEIITAQIIEIASSEDMTAKDILVQEFGKTTRRPPYTEEIREYNQEGNIEPGEQITITTELDPMTMLEYAAFDTEAGPALLVKHKGEFDMPWHVQADSGVSMKAFMKALPEMTTEALTTMKNEVEQIIFSPVSSPHDRARSKRMGAKFTSRASMQKEGRIMHIFPAALDADKRTLADILTHETG